MSYEIWIWDWSKDPKMVLCKQYPYFFEYSQLNNIDKPIFSIKLIYWVCRNHKAEKENKCPINTIDNLKILEQQVFDNFQKTVLILIFFYNSPITNTKCIYEYILKT